MSHNKITLNSISPDSDGEINSTIDSMSDVSTSGDGVLEYDGASWDTQPATGGRSLEYSFYINTGTWAGGAFAGVNDTLRWRSGTGVEHNGTYATGEVHTGGSSQWRKGVVIEPGTWLLWVQTQYKLTSADEVAWRWENITDGTNHGNYASLSGAGRFGAVCACRVTVAAQKTFRIVCQSFGGSPTITNYKTLTQMSVRAIKL